MKYHSNIYHIIITMNTFAFKMFDQSLLKLYVVSLLKEQSSCFHSHYSKNGIITLAKHICCLKAEY